LIKSLMMLLAVQLKTTVVVAGEVVDMAAVQVLALTTSEVTIAIVVEKHLPSVVLAAALDQVVTVIGLSVAQAMDLQQVSTCVVPAKASDPARTIAPEVLIAVAKRIHLWTSPDVRNSKQFNATLAIRARPWVEIWPTVLKS
jgi:hypothetical protein